MPARAIYRARATHARARGHQRPRSRRTGVQAQSPLKSPPPLSVLVLAAGQGKRMHSALPKVLQPLGGQPLLAHVLQRAAELHPAAIHVVYGHGGERVREAFGAWRPESPDSAAPTRPALRWVHQAEQLGTGHAVAQALPGVPDEHQVLVLYGDVPLLRTETLGALRARAGAGLALLTARLADPTGYGRIVRDRRGGLRSIIEQADASPAQRRIEEINTGVLVAPAARMRAWLAGLSRSNAQGEYLLTDVIAMAVREGLPIASLQAEEASEVLGINDRLQLAAAESVYRARRAAELMARGVTIIDPMRIDLRGAIEVGRDVVLEPNVIIEGPVRLGDGVRIGASCLIQQASIGAGTQVHPHSIVQAADVGSDCRIGPFARLRPGAQLADGAHIGNFVEIKNSSIGARTKINHLSYIGDATVGAGVNIGAGTITCNYDGVDKWPTTIGDDAFIGSGSMLVAPVTIGAGATIGAGSTITADAPAGKLTLARSRQQVIEQWQRRSKKR